MSRRRVKEIFSEYTPAQLAEAIQKLGDPDSGVEIELQDPDGAVLYSGVVRLHVGPGNDIDRSGVYRWVKITGRLEP